MATPRARGGISLTTSPPIRISPLVCCSSPQMMRRYVVLPQPDGPSSTMNSPSGTVRLMPSTAGTSPNFLTISLVNTAAIEPPGIQRKAAARECARPGLIGSGLAGPLLEDVFALAGGPFDRVLRAQRARGRFRHHVGNDE